MCLAVYLSSPAKLPLVAWHEESPAFYVQDVEASDPVRSHFRWPNVYYAGSHEGCGCGFAYGLFPENLRDEQTAQDDVRGKASLSALRQYVADATRANPLQLYACWEGEQGLPEKERVAASLDDLGGDSFEFTQLRMLEFPPSK